MSKLLFNLIHPIVVGITTLLFGIYGFLASSFYFIGREVAQAEYRAIEHTYNHNRDKMPWWKGLDIRLWDFHSWFWNLMLPIILGTTILIIRKIVGL